jgi:hypothetical protein
MMKRLVIVALVAIASAGCAGSDGPTASGILGPTPPDASPSSHVSAVPSTAPTRPATIGPGTTDGAVGTTFADPEGAYSITVPDEWVATHGAFAQGVESWFTGPAQDGFRPNVNVLVQVVGEMDLYAYGVLSTEGAPTLIAEYELVDSRTEIGEGGTELGVMEYRGRVAAGGPLGFLAVYAISEENAIVATLTASMDTYAAQRDAWLPYLLTLEPT